MSSIRLLHIIDNLDRGGTQTWLMILVEGLAGAGFEQRVYNLNEVFNPGIVDHLARYAPVTTLGRPRLYSLLGVGQLYRGLRAWRPDIVQTILPFSDLLGRPLARLLGVPVISSIQARNAHQPPLQLFLARLTARWANRFVSVSRQAIPFAIAHEGVPPDKVIYIPNSVQPDPIDHQAGAALRAGLGLAPETVVLGMVARLVPKKAHRDLLSAYAQVAQVHPHTALLLAGDGPLRQKLQAQARQLNLEKRVFFLGNRADTPNILAALDLFVHPSLSEGMPHAVMEAMAAGLPVLATGVDGVLDLIVDGESGWLAAPADPAGLARRMIWVLDHRELWPPVGRAAARRIVADFSPSQMIQAYSRVYRELLRP